MSAWERELPLGVAVGKDLYRSSEILQMGESGASAEEVFDFIQSKFTGRDLFAYLNTRWNGHFNLSTHYELCSV